MKQKIKCEAAAYSATVKHIIQCREKPQSTINFGVSRLCYVITTNT